MNEANRLDRERTFAIAKRALELMQDYGPCATPRSFAVWYQYVDGTAPEMNDAIKRLTTQNGALSDADATDLYEKYSSEHRLASQAEKTNASLVAEIESMMEMLDRSLGATAQYGASLWAVSQDLTSAPTRQRLREIASTLMTNTQEVVANNRILEARMRDSGNEIRSLREALEASRIESLTDSLTGLWNRKHLEKSLRKHTQERLVGDPACLVVIDVDFFKRFNDLYGHLTGDQVLRLVAMVMQEHVLETATLARFGGEEFGILLPRTPRAAAVAAAENIRKSVAGRELIKRSTGESLGKITISLGVAEQRVGDDPVSLMERADACLFAAKRAGRNRVIDDAQDIDLSHVA